jgi:hypothetical protein
MIELRTRYREMTGDGTTHHAKLGLNRNSCARKFTVPVTADKSSDLACYHRNMWPSQPSQSSNTPDFPYLLVSCTSVSSSSTVSHILIYHSIMIAEHKDMLYLIMSQCHVHEGIPITAYTEYSIHWVQHTLSTAYAWYGMHQRLSVFPSFSWLWVNPWMQL